jgi:hypothetical protein
MRVEKGLPQHQYKKGETTVKRREIYASMIQARGGAYRNHGAVVADQLSDDRSSAVWRQQRVPQDPRPQQRGQLPALRIATVAATI